jgi:hypothetical protein
LHPPHDDGRRRHYAGFYGLEPLPDRSRPLVLVFGNCQAEALRGVLAASTDEVATVRMPPVHELEADDLPHLDRLLARADRIVAQPVRDDWRDLPVGTAQIAARAPGARLVLVPVVRHTGLHPWAALVRTPWMGDPPVVPYHDLRTILRVARGAAERPAGHGAAAGFREVERLSLAELRAREDRHGALRASDLVVAAGADAMLTINHPGNAVLVPLAGRVLAACGVAAEARDPGRTLLNAVRAPVRRGVLDALGHDPAAARDAWLVGDRTIDDDEVAAAQHGWYAERPAVVEAALRRYAPAIRALGL